MGESLNRAATCLRQRINITDAQSAVVEARNQWLSRDHLIATLQMGTFGEEGYFDLARECRLISHLIGDSVLEAISLGRMAAANYQAARYDAEVQKQIIAWLRQSVESAQNGDDAELLAEGREQLASVLVDVDLPDQANRLREACQLFELAIDASDDSYDQEDVARAKSNYSLALIRRGRLDKDFYPFPRALDLANEALEYRLTTNNELNQGYSYQHRAVAHLNYAARNRSITHLGQALKDLTSAITKAEAVGDKLLATAARIDFADGALELAAEYSDDRRLTRHGGICRQSLAMTRPPFSKWAGRITS